MAFELPRIPRGTKITDGSGTVIERFRTFWQSVVTKIETQEQTQDDLLAAILAAQDAADAANAAAAAADAAATSAQDTADTITADQALINSYVSGLTLTATDAGADVTIAISAHTRNYGDATTLAIAGPTNLTGRSYSTTYYIYYDDSTRADTTPSFQTTTSAATAAQGGDRHTVGSVTTPAAAGPPSNGDGVQPPGVGDIR